MRCLPLQPALSELLRPDSDCERQKNAAQQLHRLLSEFAEFDGAASVNRTDSVLPYGVALAPFDAAACLTDYPRTAKFSAGVIAAVRAAQQKFPGERIEVVYAGCGPFALLVLPLTLEFEPHEVHFTLLDVHAHSLQSAQTLFRRLDLEDYVTDWIECDATTHQLPQGRFHVLVSETMRKGLVDEPQVAITLNLMPQMVESALLVPERIVIDAYADDFDDEELFHTEDMTPAPGQGRRSGARALGTVFEVNAALKPPDAERHFPGVVVTMPEADGPRHLVLCTRIHLFGDIVLDDYESGLTYPTVARTLGRLTPGTRVRVYYFLDRTPRFCYEVL